MKSPQSTRISGRGGRTELHTSSLIYASHPSSSSSLSGVYPKVSHTRPLPHEAECPEESVGLCAVPTNLSKNTGPQATGGTRNTPQRLLSHCSHYWGRQSLFWAKETAQVRADTWLWDLRYQQSIRVVLRRVVFQISEG